MKTIKQTIYLIAMIICVSFMTTSCKEEESDDSEEYDGSIESIEQFFNSDIVNALNDLGFEFNTGNNPPTIDGAYIASPFILESSSVQGDANGTQFLDYFIDFFNQNTSALTVDFTSNNGGQSSNGSGSFISGEGNLFSVYLKADSTYQGETAKFAYAISGEIAEDGIYNFQFANLMLDDNGDPAGIWISNNTGRLLSDSDGFSPKQ